MIHALLFAAALSMGKQEPRRLEEPAPKRPVAGFGPVDPNEEMAKRKRAEQRFAEWRNDPVQFVRDQFKAEPDAWQKDALYAVRDNQRVAMSACKGPGKSCVLAWTIWWFLLTHPDSKILALSITADNLADNLWTELSTWLSKSPLLQAAFKLSAEQILSRERPDTWWVSARAFAKEANAEKQADSLAGFHGKNIMIVLDEVGDYPLGVLAAAKAIFATRGQNAKLVAAGNPTRIGGGLHWIVTADAENWHLIYITGDPDDPKRSPRIDIEWARAEIAKWGREFPWVMVNILGQFPPAGDDQLISINDVIAAQKRDIPALAYMTDAIVWGVDPSYSIRSGADEAALARRQGRLIRKLITWRGKDGPQLAAAINRMIIEAEKNGEKPDAVFIDRGGVGASCYDHLKLLRHDDIVIPVDFGGKAHDDRFADKRTEMWWELAEWVHTTQSCLPNDSVLQGELTAPKFEFTVRNKRSQLALESKKAMKKRGVPSPNRADACALTFAEPVVPRRGGTGPGGRDDGDIDTSYTPFEEAA